MVIARPVARVSTELIQDAQLKHSAQFAERGSTGRGQEERVNRRARTVPRTRTRLLRAVLEPPALATQVTLVTPAQEHAQLV